jgi:ATP-binding cassette, subfamily B (MDR/TAP), member 1
MMYENASEVASMAVSNIRTVASFSAEERLEQLYQKKCDGPLRAGIKLGIVCGIGLGVSTLVMYCISATIFYAGAHLVEQGRTNFSIVFRVLVLHRFM